MIECFDLLVIGDPTAVHNQIQLAWFAERGHRVRLLTDLPRPVPGVEVIPVTWLPGSGGYARHLKAIWNVRRIVKADPPDLLQVHMPVPYGYWTLATRFRPQAVSLWGDDVLTDPYKSALVRRLVIRSLESADLLFTDAGELVDAARKLTVKTQPIHVLQWGVDFEKDLAHLPSREERQRFVMDGPPTLLGFRRLVDRLRPLDIIRAFARVRRDIPEARLIMAGSGDLESQAQELAREIGVAEAVDFTGWVSFPDLLSLMARSHVALTVPDSDGTPHSLLMAMAVPCAIVASDIPANREWIEEGQGGHRVPAGDIEAIAAACVHLLKNRDRCWRFAQYNETIVKQRADRQSHFLRLESLYREAIIKSGHIPPP